MYKGHAHPWVLFSYIKMGSESMQMYLTEVSSGERVQIPLLPDKVSVSTGANVLSASIIGLGDVKIPRGSNLMGYSWSGVFPGETMRDYSFVDGWQSPASIVSTLRDWMEGGKTLTLLVTELTINEDVFIESFSYEYSGGGGAVSYSIALTLRRSLMIDAMLPPVAEVPELRMADDDTADSSGNAGKAKKYGKVKTNGSNLHVRKKPSTNAAIIGKYANGKKVELLGKRGNWYVTPYAKGTGGKGYLYASYVRVISG